MRIGIVFIGESFRTGLQGSRQVGTDEGLQAQRDACDTHLRWLTHLVHNKGHELDVFFSTTRCVYSNQLIEWYKQSNLLRSCFIINPEESSYAQHFINASDLISTFTNNNTCIYDFVFVLRIDLFLKDDFTKVFDAHVDNSNLVNHIMFPSICFTLNNSHVYVNKPRVNDTMIGVPQRYLGLFYMKTLSLAHESWYNLVNSNIGISDQDIKPLLNTYHDSDSYKDWNPIYKFCGRQECQTHYSKGLLFDQQQFISPRSL